MYIRLSLIWSISFPDWVYVGLGPWAGLGEVQEHQGCCDSSLCPTPCQAWVLCNYSSLCKELQGAATQSSMPKPKPTIPASCLVDHNYTPALEAAEDDPEIDLDYDEVNMGRNDTCELCKP